MSGVKLKAVNATSGLLTQLKCSDAGELNVNVSTSTLSVNVDGLEGLVGTTNGKLDTINTTLTAGGVVDISTLSTHVKQDTTNTKLDTLNTSLGTISTQAKQDTTNTKLDTLNTSLGTLSTHAKQDTTNTKLDTLNTTLGTLSTHAKQDTLNTTLTNAEHHLGIIEVYTASTSSALTATNSKLDTIDSQIDLIEANNTIKDVEWLSGATISDQSLSAVLDTEGYQNVFIYGENSGLVNANDLKIFGSNETSGTYYSVGQLSVTTSDSGRYLLREDTPLSDMPSPRYLKVFNATGSSKTITKLRAVMSNKLRYV